MAIVTPTQFTPASIHDATTHNTPHNELLANDNYLLGLVNSIGGLKGVQEFPISTEQRLTVHAGFTQFHYISAMPISTKCLIIRSFSNSISGGGGGGTNGIGWLVTNQLINGTNFGKSGMGFTFESSGWTNSWSSGEQAHTTFVYVDNINISYSLSSYINLHVTNHTRDADVYYPSEYRIFF